MTKKCVTIDQVMLWKPCNPPYSREYVSKLFGRRKTLTASQILVLKIKLDDKFWAVLRPELIDGKTLRLFACDCRERTLRRERKAGREPDKRSWKAVQVARQFAYGKATEKELVAARSAAWDAAWDAASDAARSAASDAARSAAWDAEREWQVEHLRKMLKK